MTRIRPESPLGLWQLREAGACCRYHLGLCLWWLLSSRNWLCVHPATLQGKECKLLYGSEKQGTRGLNPATGQQQLGCFSSLGGGQEAEITSLISCWNVKLCNCNCNAAQCCWAGSGWQWPFQDCAPATGTMDSNTAQIRSLVLCSRGFYLGTEWWVF